MLCQRYLTASYLLDAEKTRGTSQSWELFVGWSGEVEQTALHLAASADQPEMLNLLLAAGASIEAEVRYPRGGRGEFEDGHLLEGDTALHIAARRGHLGCVEVLLGRDISATFRPFYTLDTETRNASGQTALHAAAACGDRAVVKSLLTHGYSRRAYDNRGKTPLSVTIAAYRAASEAGDAATSRAHREVAFALMGWLERLNWAWRELTFLGT